MEKGREVVELTEEAKRRTWRAKLDGTRESKDINKAWRLIHVLRGKKSEDKDGVALEYRGRVCLNNKAKANAFI